MSVIRAAIEGDVETVKQWLSSPHAKHPKQVAQVLERAARYGYDSVCQLLLDSGKVHSDVILVALETACKNNKLSTARLLVKHCDTSIRNSTGLIMETCAYGNERIVKWLTSDVMRLSQSDGVKWRLIATCARGKMSDIKQLATQVVSDVTRFMSHALRVACYNGRDDVEKWLTSHTTANARDRGVIGKVDGEVTSLMVACNLGHNNIARRLLQCVTPHTVNMMSGTVANIALHFVIYCETEKHRRMQMACIDSDIDTVTAMLHLSNVNLQISGGYTALHFACTRGDVEIVRMLLSVFADTHITDDQRHTPAMVAEIHGHTEVMPYLQRTLSAPPTGAVHVVSSNNDSSVSISVLSVEAVVKHGNTCSTSRKSKSRSVKRSDMKIV